VWAAIGLTACGGGGSGTEEPLNVDYSALRIAESNEAPLEYARTDEQVLLPLRNGLRMMLGGGLATPAGTVTASDTTVQVEGVDEADSVEYDARYIYATRPEILPSASTVPQLSRNVLDITRTDASTAAFERVSRFVIEGERSSVPLLYQLQTPQGATEYLVAISQNFQAWLMPQTTVATLLAQPDRTAVQLLDVRDPRNVSQAWQLELDGWLRASRLIGDTLYVVTSYRPRIPDLVLPADTLAKQQQNERRIRSSTARDLLPGYTENGGAHQPLVARDGCLIAQQLTNNDAYMDLLVISAINVRTRRVTDVNCLSTDINGVYMSRTSLYVAGTRYRLSASDLRTVLHKFALEGGQVTYRATGAVIGTIGFTNPSYFMDERDGDLRILTSGGGAHRLTVLREGSGRTLARVSGLPNEARPAPIGKPGESIYAVRFVGERAYVVTFRITDPLYVIDLHDPADPAIAGELVIPGFSTYLRPVGTAQSQLLLSVGQDVNAAQRREGIKVELFDVRDIAHPQSIGAEVFGRAGTWSDALNDPHALSFVELPGTETRYRLALPIRVYETTWAYSGLHVLEIANSATGTPQLHFQGVIKTEEAGTATPIPTFVLPERGVLHGDSVFAIHGERVFSSLWQNLPGG
jgi:hypothetical protein